MDRSRSCFSCDSQEKQDLDQSIPRYSKAIILRAPRQFPQSDFCQNSLRLVLAALNRSKKVRTTRGREVFYQVPPISPSTLRGLPRNFLNPLRCIAMTRLLQALTVVNSEAVWDRQRHGLVTLWFTKGYPYLYPPLLLPKSHGFPRAQGQVGVSLGVSGIIDFGSWERVRVLYGRSQSVPLLQNWQIRSLL